jgi:alkanesulfonate monooxygenase SsuD/methylene tetrahydromethanopterin reductase-like flavin-dependent oxidoreductase (luciferase family)
LRAYADAGPDFVSVADNSARISDTIVDEQPHTAGGPTVMWGGGAVAAARRAGRYGLGMLDNANVAGMQETYEAACREHGHEPGLNRNDDKAGQLGGANHRG